MSKKRTIKETVKGGSVTRDRDTGRALSVESGKASSRATPATATILNETASRRHDALKRLVNR
ncbi:MAG: hypothetical protein AAFS07_15775 [Pseudomonadota bacterium]